MLWMGTIEAKINNFERYEEMKLRVKPAITK